MEISCPLCHVVFKDAKALKQHWLENAPEGCDWGKKHEYDNIITMEHEAEELSDVAEVHWAYTEKMMRLAYVEAFRHGYKHGREDEKTKEPPKVSSY